MSELIYTFTLVLCVAYFRYCINLRIVKFVVLFQKWQNTPYHYLFFCWFVRQFVRLQIFQWLATWAWHRLRTSALRIMYEEVLRSAHPERSQTRNKIVVESAYWENVQIISISSYLLPVLRPSLHLQADPRSLAHLTQPPTRRALTEVKAGLWLPSFLS